MNTQIQNIRLILIAGLVLSSILTTGCNKVRLDVPKSEKVGMETLKVSDRSTFLTDRGFKLGNYKVSDVDRDWDTTTTTGIGPISKGQSNGGYAFKLKGKPQSISANCYSQSNNNKVDLGAGWGLGNSNSSLKCQCGEDAKLSLMDAESYRALKQKDNDAEVELTKHDSELFASLMQHFKGDLLLNGKTYPITSLHQSKQSDLNPMPMGYQVKGEKENIGIVEVVQPGQVWLNQNLSAKEKTQLTCLLTSLMFYQPNEQ